MIDNKAKFIIKKSTEKNFGIVFTIFFLIISFYPLIQSKTINFYFLICAFIMIIFTLVFPKLLKYPNFLWFKLGILLGSIISPIIMFLIYILVFLPIGIYFKLLKRDSLKIKIDQDVETYWVNRVSDKSSMKNQF